MLIKASVPVRVLDVSSSGVLLTSKTRLFVGERAKLHATIGTRAVDVGVEIRHTSIETQPRGDTWYRAGASLTPMSADRRLAFERLLRVERP